MNEKDSQEVFVGIDVCKGRLDIFDGESRQFGNDGSGIKKLVLRLKKLNPKLIVLESTGGYEGELMAALWDAKLPFSQVNPNKTKAFAKSLAHKLSTASDSFPQFNKFYCYLWFCFYFFNSHPLP